MPVPDSRHETVLMVDDDPQDCMPASDAFAESGANLSFACVKDGVGLLDYLLECSRSGEKKLPALILLDLSMPCNSPVLLKAPGPGRCRPGPKTQRPLRLRLISS